MVVGLAVFGGRKLVKVAEFSAYPCNSSLGAITVEGLMTQTSSA